MGFSKQEYWSGLPFPSPEDLPDPGIEPGSPALQADSLPSGFPGGSDSKPFAYNVGDPGWLSGSGRSPGEGNGNLLQYSCLGNAMDRGAWWATVHEVTKSRTRLSD